MCLLGKASISALLTFLNLFWFSSERETIIIEAVHVRKTLSGCSVKITGTLRDFYWLYIYIVV